MADRTIHRSITERWVVEGTLVLKTPARFGNGDADPLTDMPLLRNEVDGKPLLTGSSIAGALRNYLRELEEGYGRKERKNSMASLLFGSPRELDEESEKKGMQSPLIVDDAVCDHVAGFELRDGVAIDPETRTAADNDKFDMQLLAAGSTFPLRFELIVSENSPEGLRDALVTALHGLETGAITLGARKRRGFGECEVRDWHVWKYDLTTQDGLLDWLASDHDWRISKAEQTGNDLAAKLNAAPRTNDARVSAHLSATFKLNGTLMIRSGFGDSDRGPDTVHIHAKRNGKDVPQPILPGTSLAGVLRQRALKIARTVSNDNKAKSQEFVDAMFGPEVKRGDKHARASRVTIKETEIDNHTSLVVTRVKIDRFTGGAYEGALFSEQPLVGKPNTRLKMELTLRKNSKLDLSEDEKKGAEKEFQAEIGLLLLLLKDLWTGDLPIGGESGIGRGRLTGESATLRTPYGTWEFKADGEKVNVEPNADELEKWVTAFNNHFKEAQVES